MGDLVCVRIFFPKPLVIVFYPDIQSHCLTGISLQCFFGRNQSAGYFFLKSHIPPPPTPTPSKVVWSAPKKNMLRGEREHFTHASHWLNALSVSRLFGEERGLISRTAVGNRASFFNNNSTYNFYYLLQKFFNHFTV